MRDAEQQRLHALARRTENDELRLQAQWPARVQLRAPEVEKTYAGLPYAFADAYAPVADDALRALSLACKLLRGAESLLVAPPAPSARLASPALRAVAAQTEALAALAACTGGNELVWTAVRDAQTRLAHALSAEELYRTRRRALSDLDDAEAREYAASRGVAIRVALAGVAALAGERGPHLALWVSVERYCEARQLASDLLGWRSDLAAARPSIVLARLAREVPDAFRAAESGDAHALSRALFAGGVARDVVAIVATTCEQALRAAADVRGAGRWAAVVDVLAARARVLASEFAQKRTASA